MDLEALARRLDYERGEPKASKEIMIMDSDGFRYPVLSVSWDDEREAWVIVGDYDEQS